MVERPGAGRPVRWQAQAGGASLSSRPRPSPAVSFGETPLGERIPWGSSAPNLALGSGSPSRGEALGVRAPMKFGIILRVLKVLQVIVMAETFGAME
ncbi:hypothetical protein A6R68_13706 [Neotoma lepida]|uniref:Uncharacterized protein n=1 Tax=Neotoma lepida TaxID=56216 RepID=A0A1A6H269_NEOLE|nr:hypothetical protein A6R68_13706 [Neotoma lepida]